MTASLSLALLAVPNAANSSRQTNLYAAELTARSFFVALVKGQPTVMSTLCADPINLDGRWVSGSKRIEAAVAELVERAQNKMLRLRQVRLVSLRDMVAAFGPAPKRIRSAIKSSDLIALARFDGQGVVAVLGRKGRLWQVKALSD